MNILFILFLVLPWPVWTLAQVWSTACVNVVTVDPDVRGWSAGQQVTHNQTHNVIYHVNIIILNAAVHSIVQ